MKRGFILLARVVLILSVPAWWLYWILPGLLHNWSHNPGGNSQLLLNALWLTIGMAICTVIGLGLARWYCRRRNWEYKGESK